MAFAPQQKLTKRKKLLNYTLHPKKYEYPGPVQSGFPHNHGPLSSHGCAVLEIFGETRRRKNTGLGLIQELHRLKIAEYQISGCWMIGGVAGYGRTCND